MKFKFMLPAMALVVLAGCAKEQQVIENPVPQKGTFVFTSSTGDATKVALNADNSLYWTAGDQIAVYNYKDATKVQQDVALITSGEGTSVATFTPNTHPDKTDWYLDGDGDSQAYVFSAFYPGSAATPDGSKNVTLSSVAASQTEAAGVGSYIISWATANTTKATLAAGTAPNFAFAPKTALLKLAIRNSNSSSLSARIENITLTADNGYIAGSASLNLETGILTGGNQSVITYTPAEPIVLAYGASLELPVLISLLPNDEITKLTVNFSIPDCTSPAIDLALASHLESGHVYSKLANITTITSTKKVIPTPDPGAKTLATSGLLEENKLYYGNANSIVMASSATSATIDITLYESANGYTRSGTTSSSYSSAVAEAKIIWAEAGLYNDTAFKIKSATSTTLTIGKTAGTTGNALIGIYDTNGDLLWSYHVWVPADNSVIEFTGDNKTAVTYSEAFKLALGQIEDEEDTYMWYQWGRKDPMGRANGFSSGNVMVPTYGTAPSVSNMISRTGTGCGSNNLSYARQNPWMYIVDDNVTPYDWYPGATSNTQNNNLWTSAGSIYDPCPSGYHVPANQTLWKDAEAADLVRDGEDKIIGLRKYGVYYTLGGYRNRASAGVDYVASYGYFWSVTANGVYERLLLFNTSGTVYPQNYYNRADGFGVRCVKD